MWQPLPCRLTLAADNLSPGGHDHAERQELRALRHDAAICRLDQHPNPGRAALSYDCAGYDVPGKVSVSGTVPTASWLAWPFPSTCRHVPANVVPGRTIDLHDLVVGQSSVAIAQPHREDATSNRLC